MRFLIFGDIVGKIGRHALRATLPDLREELKPDIVLANGENLAHGLGATESTLNEVRDAGVTLFTSGNHIWNKPEGVELLRQTDPPIIRPANYPPSTPGVGWKMLSVAGKDVLVVNLLGRVFMKDLVDDPFHTIDTILAEHPAIVTVIDFHAEVTSEKCSLGWYLNGRASILYGTHTHIATADTRILPKGTAYVTDVGMTGARDSVLGVDPATAIPGYTTGIGTRFVWPETGVAIVQGIIVDVEDASGTATHIERFEREVTIT
ncbi:MAG: TIGR00282 family metallophosphoesterase [Candidatus Uhrbacteria bacterium]